MPADHLYWYAVEFQSNLVAHKASERRRQEEIISARGTAAARRTTLLVTIGAALSGLLTILVLPLLIMIEQNTRRLRAQPITPAGQPVSEVQ